MTGIAFCASCGNCLTAGHLFCTACGASAATIPPAATNPPETRITSRTGTPSTTGQLPSVRDALTELPGRAAMGSTAGPYSPGSSSSALRAWPDPPNVAYETAIGAETRPMPPDAEAPRQPGYARAAFVAVTLVAALTAGGTGYVAVSTGLVGFKQTALAPGASVPAPAHRESTSASTQDEPVPTTTTTSARPKPPTVTPVGPDASASTSDEALGLSTLQARQELGHLADDGASNLAPLAGSWVAQVSSKCEGIRVDIEPGWQPDGTKDVASVTAQQILAFHLALNARFGAITVRPTALGTSRDVATRGVCRGKVAWTSIVPNPFHDSAAANAWCDTYQPPRDECQARLVAAPGSGHTQTVGRSS
ncbi:MAG: hypothetical protein QG597_4399 [Actinomycetota bacterium]|nr:hypothetical protein [Actinomycetota bacterium]